jgi:hypothetical protein
MARPATRSPAAWRGRLTTVEPSIARCSRVAARGWPARSRPWSSGKRRSSFLTRSRHGDGPQEHHPLPCRARRAHRNARPRRDHCMESVGGAKTIPAVRRPARLGPRALHSSDSPVEGRGHLARNQDHAARANRPARNRPNRPRARSAWCSARIDGSTRGAAERPTRSSARVRCTLAMASTRDCGSASGGSTAGWVMSMGPGWASHTRSPPRAVRRPPPRTEKARRPLGRVIARRHPWCFAVGFRRRPG